MKSSHSKKSTQVPEHSTTSPKKQFPRIYLFFSEWFGIKRWKAWQVWVIVVSILLALLVGAMGIQYAHLKNSYKHAEREREKVVKEVQFWEKITEKYPDYRDAYFRLAVLEYQLNRKEESKEYLQKSLELDPNFQKGRELEQLLQ